MTDENPHLGSLFSDWLTERGLDPTNDKVQLDTMQRAAAAVGRKLRPHSVELCDYVTYVEELP